MENIEVSVRLRPMNVREIQNNEEPVWRIEKSAQTITLDQHKTSFVSPPASNQGTSAKKLTPSAT